MNELTNKEIRFHPTHDVAVVRFATSSTKTKLGFDTRIVSLVTNTVISSTESAVVPMEVEGLRCLANVQIGDDVFVFGYPSSIGLRESPRFDYSKPLLRKGIISGIHDDAKTIIVDSAVYFGNSGGPVLEVEHVDLLVTRFSIIGVVSEMIPFVDLWENKRFDYMTANVSNSGYAVIEPVDFVLELLWE